MYTYDYSQNVTFPAGVKATSFTENGTALSSKYLGINAKAADADKLDSHDSSYFAVKGSATGGAAPGTDSQGGHSSYQPDWDTDDPMTNIHRGSGDPSRHSPNTTRAH